MFEKIVANISSRFVNMPDHLIDNGIKRTLKEVCEFIGAIRGWIFLLSDDNMGISISLEWCSTPSLCRKPFILNFPLKEFPFISSKFQNLEDVLLDVFFRVVEAITEQIRHK